MSVFKRLVLVLPLLTLTGCFDFLEEIWILPDGSGRVRIDIGLTSALFALPGIGSKEKLMDDVHENAKQAAEAARSDPDVKSVKVETKDEGGLFHLIYEIEVKDVTKLADVQRRIL